MEVQIPDRDKVDVQITPAFIGKDYVVYEVWWQGGKSWHRVQGLKAKIIQMIDTTDTAARFFRLIFGCPHCAKTK